MWMFEGDAPAAAGIAASGAPAEVFVRNDGDDRLVLGDGGAPAGATPATVLFTGGAHGPDAGAFLFKVGMWTPESERHDFLAWYETDHLPLLLEHPTWDGCRFVEVDAAEGCQFYVLHQVQDRAALASPARERSRDTAWFHRLKRHAWFDEPFRRILYRRTEEAAP